MLGKRASCLHGANVEPPQAEIGNPMFGTRKCIGRLGQRRFPSATPSDARGQIVSFHLVAEDHIHGEAVRGDILAAAHWNFVGNAQFAVPIGLQLAAERHRDQIVPVNVG